MNAPTIQLTTLPAAILLMLITGLLVACGGGGDEQSSSLTSQPIESNLPLGDIISGDFFPLETGNRWIFDVTQSDSQIGSAQSLLSVSIGGSTQIKGQLTQELRYSNPETSESLDLEYVAKTTNAVRILYEDDVSSFDELRLPIRKNERFVQVDRKGVDTGEDYDGDGINETVTFYFDSIVEGVEDVQTSAGLFAKALKVKGQGSSTYQFSTSGQIVVVRHLTDNWYVDGIGRVKSIDQFIYPNKTQTLIRNLKSYKVGLRTNDVVVPSITQVTPSSNSQQGARPVVRIQFSENIDRRSLNNANIQLLSSNGQPVLGVIDYANQQLTFTPQQSLDSGVYIFKLTANTVMDLIGNKLSPPLEIRFNVDANAPSVVATTPQANAKMVPLSSNITVDFSEELGLGSLSSDSIKLYKEAGGLELVPSTLKIQGKRITLTPDSVLERNKKYVIYVYPTVKDLVGNPLPELYSYTFVSESGAIPFVKSTYPSQNAIVNLSTHEITLDFSAVLDDFMASTQSIKMMRLNGEIGSEDIAIAINREGARITVTPERVLKRGGQYQLCVYTTIVDAIGNPLLAPYCLNFAVEIGAFMPVQTIAVGSPSEAVTIGDVNGDGLNDVIMTTSYALHDAADFNLLFFLQQQDGTLTNPVKYPLPRNFECVVGSLAVADLNGDGKNEVVVAENSCGIEVFAQDNQGKWSSRELTPSKDTYKVRVADLNNDGKADIVGAGWNTNTVSVWYQQNGTLKAPVSYTIAHTGFIDLEVDDINSDGLQDIVLLGGHQYAQSATLGYLLQLPKGGFAAADYLASVGVNSQTGYGAIGIGDIGGDGQRDIVMVMGWDATDSQLSLFTQQSNGKLIFKSVMPTLDTSKALAIEDVDNNGRSDVVIPYANKPFLSFRPQSVDGTLQKEELYDIPYGMGGGSEKLAIGDINNDGYKDIVMTGAFNELAILYNNGVNNQPLTRGKKMDLSFGQYSANSASVKILSRQMQVRSFKHFLRNDGRK
ncbi:MAG: Ig-like domain-containing protein [Agitococcus sp.]|nr:Ig-like domain-containing protein [Agitococcus sp.]